MHKRNIATEGKEVRLINTEELAAYVGIGKAKAASFGKEAGAAVRLGSRLLFDKRIIDKKLDQLAGN